MPYIVPGPTPAPPTGLGQFASSLGGDIDKVKDLLLAALLSGQLGPVPQGTVAPTGDIHNMPLSGGRQFSGRASAAQRLIPQDIQGFQNQINRGTAQPKSLPPGLGFTPTGKSALRFQPPLTRPLQQAQLEQAQAETALKTKQGNWYDSLINGTASATGAVFDSATGGMRPVLPGEEPQFLITPTKSGKTITSLAPTNKINAEMKENEQKKEESSVYVRESASDALDAITEIEKGIQHFGTFGQLTSIPGTERTVWEANVNKLLSGKVLQVMDAMKRASKAGGTGFGQLSNKELVVLQQAATALKRQLPPSEAQKILKTMKEKLSKIAQSEAAGQQQSQSFNSEQEALAANLPPGTEVTINGKRAVITP